MKVWNLTDVATPVLQQRALVGVLVRVGDADVAPGAYADVKDNAKLRAELGPLLLIGAVCLGEPPESYKVASRSASLADEERKRAAAEQEAEARRKADADAILAASNKVEEEKAAPEAEKKGKSK